MTTEEKIDDYIALWKPLRRQFKPRLTEREIKRKREWYREMLSKEL